MREATREELVAYGKGAAAKAKINGAQFAALETKLALRRRSPDTHFDEIANAAQDKTSPPPGSVGTEATNEQPLQGRPCWHPYYWGSFVYTGL